MSCVVFTSASVTLFIHSLCYDSVYSKNSLDRENVFLLSNNVGYYTATSMLATLQARSLLFRLPIPDILFLVAYPQLSLTSILDSRLSLCQPIFQLKAQYH